MGGGAFLNSHDEHSYTRESTYLALYLKNYLYLDIYFCYPMYFSYSIYVSMYLCIYVGEMYLSGGPVSSLLRLLDRLPRLSSQTDPRHTNTHLLAFPHPEPF